MRSRMGNITTRTLSDKNLHAQIKNRKTAQNHRCSARNTMTLTAKQEAFTQAIASGKTQADAYRASYSAEKMNDNTVYREASLLLDNPKIATRIKEIKASLAKKQLWTREMSVKALINAYRMAEQQEQATGMIAAVKELNVMHGYDCPNATADNPDNRDIRITVLKARGDVKITRGTNA